MATEKQHMNIVFIGHVDHGKSTTVGRMLLDTGMIDQHIIDGLKKVAEEKGKATFEFAFVMDQLKEERERGVTIDVAHKRMNTEKYYFTIIDAPGHRDFVKNMITGTSQADAAVIVVGAPEGVQAQTKEHVFLSRTLGVKQIIVGINKMDAVNYDEAKYTAIKADMTKLLNSVGFKAADIPFVPYSAYKGENTAKKSALIPWYKGPSLLDALNNLKAPEQPTNLALRLPVQDVYSITGIGTVPVGRVETGIMRPNDKIHFQPSDKVAEVKSIEMHHEMIPEAKPGDNVGFNCRGIAKTDIKRGDVAGPSSNPPTVAKLFKGQIMVLNHPSVISAGYTPIFHCHTAQIACTVEQLLAKLDPKTGGVKEENPPFIKTGDSAIVLIRPTKPMVIEEVKAFPQLGRFAIRDMGQTVAAGVCMKVEEKQ